MKEMKLNQVKNSNKNNVTESIIQDTSGEKSLNSEISATEFFNSADSLIYSRVLLETSIVWKLQFCQKSSSSK